MEAAQRVLFVDPSTGFYRMRRYRVGDWFGPVDLGIIAPPAPGVLLHGHEPDNRVLAPSLVGSCPCWWWRSSFGPSRW